MAVEGGPAPASLNAGVPAIPTSSGPLAPTRPRATSRSRCGAGCR